MTTHKKNHIVIHLGSIGDTIIASPLAEAIKKQHLNTQVSWICTPESAALLSNNPFIDEIIEIPAHATQATNPLQHHSSNKTQKAFQLIKELRRKEYELALDIEGSIRSGIITSLCRAKHKIGLGSQLGSNWLMSKTVSRNLGDTSQIGSEYRYLANQLGLSDQTWNMRPSTTKAQLTNTLELLKEHNITINTPYLAICPHSPTPEKRWPKEHWKQLCLRIRGRHNLKTIILGDSPNPTFAKEIASHGGAVDLTNKCSTAEAAVIIQHAQLLIGTDSDLTHLGHSYETPTLALFGPTLPYSHTGLETSKIIHKNLNCSPCAGHPTCGKRFNCMRQITPDEILSKAKNLLKKARTTHHTPPPYCAPTPSPDTTPYQPDQ